MVNNPYLQSQLKTLFPANSHTALIAVLSLFSISLMFSGLKDAVHNSVFFALFFAILIQWLTVTLLNKMSIKQNGYEVAALLWFLIVAAISVPFSGATSTERLGLNNYQVQDEYQKSYQIANEIFAKNNGSFNAYQKSSLQAYSLAEKKRKEELNEGGTCDSHAKGRGKRLDIRKEEVALLEPYRDSFSQSAQEYSNLYQQFQKNSTQLNQSSIKTLNAIIAKANSVQTASRSAYINFLNQRYARGQSDIVVTGKDRRGNSTVTTVKCPSPWLREAARIVKNMPDTLKIPHLTLGIAQNDAGKALRLVINNFQLLTLQFKELSAAELVGLLVAWMIEIITAYLMLTATYSFKRFDIDNNADFLNLLLNSVRKKNQYIVSVAVNSNSEKLLLQLPIFHFVRQKKCKQGNSIRIYRVPATLVQRFANTIEN